MGYVDRGGGREAKGASLRRSKKNPGCGASRQLNKGPITAAPVDLSQRPPAVPPPMFTAPFHTISTLASTSKKSDPSYLLLKLKKKMEENGDADVTTLDFTDPRVLARLLAPSTHEVLHSASQLVDAMSVTAMTEKKSNNKATEAEANSPYHLDSAVALFSRRLVEENTQELSRRALEEGGVSGMLCWSSEVERQAALVTHCETTLQSTPFTTTAIFQKPEEEAHVAEKDAEKDPEDEDEDGEDSETSAEGVVAPKSCLASGNKSRDPRPKRNLKREKEFKEEKRVHFDPSSPMTTVYKTDEPPSNSPTPLPNFNSSTAPGAGKEASASASADRENAAEQSNAAALSFPSAVSYNLDASLPYAVVGVHPNNIDRMNQTLQEQWLSTTASLALKPVTTTNSAASTTSSTTKAGDPTVTVKSVVGGPAIVGLLSGLDLSRKSGTHHAQEWTLRKLYKMAAALELPLVLHLRVDAAAGGNTVSATSGATSGVSFFAEPRTRTAMQQTGDRLAELLQEWCKWHSVEASLQQNHTNTSEANDEDASGDDDDDDDDGDDDEGVDGAEKTPVAMLLSKQSRAAGKKRSRHPPAIILHNAWATLALSPALQALFPLSRRTLSTATALHHDSATKTTKDLRRPVLFLSVSAEEMLASDATSDERQTLLSVLPSLPTAEAQKPTETSSQADVVALQQFLITTASPWHTPANLEDEYLRTRPNEPANYPYVVKAVLSALLEKASDTTSKPIDASVKAKLEILLRTVSTLNTLALFFGRYWVHRHQIEEQHLEELAQLAAQGSPNPSNPPSQSSAAAHAETVSPSEEKRLSAPAVKPVAQFRCAGCQANLFHSGQALWHLREGAEPNIGPTKSSLLTCVPKSDSYQLPVPLTPAALQAERQQDRLIKVNPEHSKASAATLYDNISTMGKKGKAKKNKKNKRQSNYQDSDSDDDDNGTESAAYSGGKTSKHQHHEEVIRQEGEEEYRINLHSASVQTALRAALTARFGKSFWILSAAGGSVGVACTHCKARLGSMVAIPFLAQAHGEDEHSSDDDDDDSSSDDDENFLTGSSGRQKKKKRLDKLANKKQIKRDLHAKHAQQQRGSFNGGAEGTMVSTDAASFRALPTVCRRCDETLTWSGSDAIPNAFPLTVILHIESRSVVEHAFQSIKEGDAASGEMVKDKPVDASCKRDGNAAGKPNAEGKGSKKKNPVAKSKPSSSSLEEEMELLRQQQEDEEDEEGEENSEDKRRHISTAAAVPEIEEDNELARLLREAALEREAIDREKQREEEQWAEEQEALKRQQKKKPKKNVKANNRSNFTHFRNKDFGKNVPGGAVPPSTALKHRGGDSESSDSD